MHTPHWSRDAAIEAISADIWRYLTHVGRPEPDLQLDAAALLQMPPSEMLTLALAHFILSPDVRRLLEGMGALMRRLARTTVDEEERSADRIRGPIQWDPTLAAQTETGIRHIYVTAPARRAFDTPENQVLVAALAAIVDVGRRTGWDRLGEAHLAGEVRRRRLGAQEWLSRRALSEIPPRPPSPRTLNRVSTGRARQRYQPAVDVVRHHQTIIRHLEPAAIRAAIEEHALVTANDDVLFELLCGCGIERALREDGWEISAPRLLPAKRFLTARRADTRIEVYYQRGDLPLAKGAVYEQVQREHGFPTVSRLRPDFVLRINRADGQRWIVVEVKGGPKRSVRDSARAALVDLLAYRRDYHETLDDTPHPYGLGIAWGTNLDPVETPEVVLCSWDRIAPALRLVTDD
jgi:hypothetical protein